MNTKQRGSEFVAMGRVNSEQIDDDDFIRQRAGNMGTKGYKTPKMPMGTVRTIRGDMLKIFDDDSLQATQKKAVIRDITQFLADEPWKKVKDINVLRIEDEMGGLTDFPGKMWNLTKIEILILTLSQMSSISKKSLVKLKGMPRLSQLYLPENRLKTIAGLETVNSLVVLNVNRNFLLAIPDDMSGLSYLQKLFLAGNRLKTLPESIGRLENLKELDVSANKLESLPATIGGMRSLKILDISLNQIVAIPESLGSLTSLQEVYAGNNKLTRLPANLSEMNNLHHFFLSHNQFRDVPPGLGTVPNLQSLNLCHNKISMMNPALPKIRSLLLDHNKLEVFPGAIDQCTELEVLSLEANLLTNVSPQIRRLTRLRALYLGGNKITALPDETVQLTDLRHLTLNDTNIETLPIDLPRLRKLSILDLEDTNITADIQTAYLKSGVKGVQEHLDEKKKMSMKSHRLSTA